MSDYDVIVIGGGPAGLASSIKAHDEGSKVLLIERENRLGGILKQCIHDGFGLLYFKEKLSGPEYASRFIDEFNERKIDLTLSSFVTDLKKEDDGTFKVKYINTKGISEVSTKTLILATGCRERTAKQVFINGTRPYGVFTAGSAQHFVNLLGVLPGKTCVILGSGDIGLIMARRLTLEGVKVLGVYEILPSPSGLTRNIKQCLMDYDIPLHLSTTVTRLYGENRLEAVQVSKVDQSLKAIPGTEEIIPCDSLILSVGLIPENELAEKLKVELDPLTKGPKVDENGMTSVKGVYSCGNAMQVNDLVDYVSYTAERAGYSASHFMDKDIEYYNVTSSKDLGYILPQRINKEQKNEPIDFYFRSKKIESEVTLEVRLRDNVIYEKKYLHLRPPEMEKLSLNLKELKVDGDLFFTLRR